MLDPHFLYGGEPTIPSDGGTTFFSMVVDKTAPMVEDQKFIYGGDPNFFYGG